MTALREVFASFTVEFDSGELHRGNREVRGLTDRLAAANPRVGEFVAGVRAAGPALAAGAAGVAAVAGSIGLVVHQITQATLEFAALNDELNLNAQRLGLTTDQMQALGLFAADAGQDLDRVTDAVSTLQERARDAVIDPQSDPAEQLRRLGLEIPRTTDELPDAITLLEQTADAFATMENPTDRVGAAMTLFGDSGRDLLPVLEGGADGIRAYAAELRELGGGASREAIEASSELAAQQVRLDLAITGLKTRVLGPLIPVITRVVEGFTSLVSWLNRNENFLKAVGIAFAILAGVLTALLLPVLALTFIAFLPILIVIGAIVVAVGAMILVIEDLLTWLDGGNSVIGTFVESLANLAGISLEGVREQINGVFESLRNGYNSIAEVVGLPTISSGPAAVDTSNAGPKIEGRSTPSPQRSGVLGSAVGNAFSGFAARQRADQLSIRPNELVGRAAQQVATVNQENQISITGNNPQEIAREIERVMDRQNRDAAEALAQ